VLVSSEPCQSQAACWRCGAVALTHGRCTFCGSSAVLNERAIVGSRLDNRAAIERYEIQQLVGRSGGADAFAAIDHWCNHMPVLIKRFSRRQTSSEHGVDQDYFLKRQNAVAQITHPNLIEILNSGKSDGSPYYVIPRYDGMSLEQLLQKVGVLAGRELLDLVCQLAAAVSAVNAHGYICAYLHPRNVFIVQGRFFSRLILSEPPVVATAQAIDGNKQQALRALANGAGALYGERVSADWDSGKFEMCQVRMVALVALEAMTGLFRTRHDIERRLRPPSGLPRWLSWISSSSETSRLRNVFREVLLTKTQAPQYTLESFIKSIDLVTNGRTRFEW
jgi:hypothetical protein